LVWEFVWQLDKTGNSSAIYQNRKSSKFIDRVDQFRVDLQSPV
jgi:hypothetical protein